MQPLLAALTLVFCIASIAHGVEYKTLKTDKGGSDSEIDVLPTDIVEVASASNDYTSQPYVSFQYQGGSWASSFPVNSIQTRPVLVTGITKLRLLGGNNGGGWVTIKITPAEAVAPTTVLVLPETPGGNYDLVVESSGDTVTWAPFHSQSVLSGGANAFFRVRIVKK